jgi:CRISPR system Cascade subunit CasD
LLAAALGIQRCEEEKLHALFDHLRLGVLVISSGQLLRDYHTAQVPTESSIKKRQIATRKDELSISDLKTILSTRDYRMDAYYRIALWSPDRMQPLEELQGALAYPRYTPYLGRKSCPPALPFGAEVIEAATLVEALAGYRKNQAVVESLVGSVTGMQFRLYSELGKAERAAKVHTVLRRDRLISRKAWQYAEREEVMEYVGGSDVFK